MKQKKRKARDYDESSNRPHFSDGSLLADTNDKISAILDKVRDSRAEPFLKETRSRRIAKLPSYVNFKSSHSGIRRIQ